MLVTGGVVSGLGKGVTASSIGVVLKACGLRITSIKIGSLLSPITFICVAIALMGFLSLLLFYSCLEMSLFCLNFFGFVTYTDFVFGVSIGNFIVYIGSVINWFKISTFMCCYCYLLVCPYGSASRYHFLSLKVFK